MNDVSEITILKDGNVRITNLRAIIGLQTHAMPKITSVNMGICSVLIAISNMEAYAQ